MLDNTTYTTYINAANLTPNNKSFIFITPYTTNIAVKELKVNEIMTK